MGSLRSAIALGRIGNRASLEKMERINEPSYSSQYPGLEWASNSFERSSSRQSHALARLC